MSWSQPCIFPKNGLQPIGQNPRCLLMRDDELFYCDQRLWSNCWIYSYSLKNNCWETISINHDISGWMGTLFASYKDSIIAFANSNVYSLKLPSKKQKCRKDQLENFVTELFNDKAAYPDIIFKVEDEEIPANKCILSIRCPHFKNAFTSKMMESQNKTILIKDVRAKVFKAMLQYIYFADIDLDQDIAEDLLKLSHEYGLKELMSYCEEVLVKDIQVENVVKYIKFAEQYDANQFRKACLDFVSENVDEIFKSQNIKELDSETLLELYKMK